MQPQPLLARNDDDFDAVEGKEDKQPQPTIWMRLEIDTRPPKQPYDEYINFTVVKDVHEVGHIYDVILHYPIVQYSLN